LNEDSTRSLRGRPELPLPRIKKNKEIMTTHQRIILESSASVGGSELDLSDPELAVRYADVKDDKTATNWALFGYVPKTNKIQVVGSGEGGLPEMLEELNEGAPCYAFARFEVESSYGAKSAKFAYITWAPDGVPATRKGVLHAHSQQMEKFLKGFHTQINARTEDELEESAVIDKIKRTLRR